MALCKRPQHCWPTTPNIVGCYMLRPFAHPVVCSRMLLRVDAQSFKPVKSFSQYLPPLLFLDHRSVAQQFWILPTLHCRSKHCWELLHPFAHHCQHGRNNSQHCWRNNVGSYCVRLHAALGLQWREHLLKVLVTRVLVPVSSDSAAQLMWRAQRPFFPQLQNFRK